ncbi:TetR/AcrR family transcriptional regulator [Williamsia herbipolensis]|uniref:TetR/AcrR family transcriptional regulator n=1 Tax=Williamsia herbipolensis TaxID=1603258 RepID=UPI0006990602|nr:TetR family transcriptional regulator [Williamsia herbipolensis]
MTYKQPVKRGRGRHELIASTLRSIASRGLHATTLRDIAAGAGLSLGSTTYHFPDRAALMVGALEEHVTDTERVIAAADVISRERRDARTDGGVHSALTALLADRDRVLIRHELRLEATRDPEYRDLHVRSRAVVRRIVASALRAEGQAVSDAAVNALATALEDAAIEAAVDDEDPASFTAAMTTHLDEVFAARIAG